MIKQTPLPSGGGVFVYPMLMSRIELIVSSAFATARCAPFTGAGHSPAIGPTAGSRSARQQIAHE
jgi:hypothetical protein